MGRKTKLTPELQREICKIIQTGSPLETAAAYVGITKNTFYNWLQWGEQQKKGIYFGFLNAVKKARADAVVRNVAYVQKAAVDTWQAAAWWLERQLPNEFGRRDRTEISGQGGKPIEIVSFLMEKRRRGELDPMALAENLFELSSKMEEEKDGPLSLPKKLSE